MATTKAKKIQQAKKDETIAAVSGMTPDAVADGIAKTQVLIQKKLAEVGTVVSDHLATLRNIEGAIEAKTEELKALHGIEAGAITLDELEAKIQAARETAEAERQAAQEAERQEDQERDERRKREEERYSYQLAQGRRREEDAFAATLERNKKAEAERAATLEKSWGEREAALKAREGELAELRQKADSFDARVKAEADKQVAIATNSLKKHYETEAQLKAKDAETALKLASQETAAARTEIARLTQTIGELKAQVTEAQQATRDVANKALEASSGRATTEALQRLMEKPEAQPAGRR